MIVISFPLVQYNGEGNGSPLQYSSLENPMDGGAWWAVVHGVAEESDVTEWLHFHFSLSCIGEGNGNPLQCSRLENPRDGRAWWAAVCGVAQSQTRLKRLSSSAVQIQWTVSFSFLPPADHPTLFRGHSIHTESSCYSLQAIFLMSFVALV